MTELEELMAIKTGDKILSEKKKNQNYITRQLNKDEETSYNTGFHNGFLEACRLIEKSYLGVK